jgi:hypothetical protein
MEAPAGMLKSPDEALFLEPVCGGRERIARFHAEDAVLACRTIAIILRGDEEQAAAHHDQADDQQGQQTVENVDHAIARAAAAPVPAVVHLPCHSRIAALYGLVVIVFAPDCGGAPALFACPRSKTRGTPQVNAMCPLQLVEKFS